MRSISSSRAAAPADLLADAIHQALAGHQPADQALAATGSGEMC